MGYTLVTVFDQKFEEQMKTLLESHNVNKIPFGRKCDRTCANQNMRYHMTLIHWAKEYDSIYLPLIDKLRFESFDLKITGTELLYAEEGSLLLYFSVMPSDGYTNAINHIEETMKTKSSSFLHITIAVSKDHEHIRDLKRIIDEQLRYPFCLKVTELDLYHIWKPVVLYRNILADA